MANEVVGIDIKADVRSLRTQVREATQEFLRLQESGKATSQELANAAKRVANLKDAMDDARSTIDAFNPDQKFRAFSQSIQGVAGGFAAAQGALSLFGVESENVTKQLLKVQSALALSEGLNTVLDSIQGFKNLALVLKTQVVTAFTTLRGAIVATGLGALAVGLGLLIANFDKVKQVINNLFPGLATLTKYVGGLVEKMTDFVGITSQTDRALELYAKNSKNRKTTYENELKVMEAQGASEKALSDKRKQIVQEDINVLSAKQRNNKQLTEEEVKLLNDSRNELLVIDAKYRKGIKDSQKKSNEDYLKAEEAKAQKEVELAIERAKRLDELGKVGQTDKEKKQDEIKTQLEKDLELFKNNEDAKAIAKQKADEQLRELEGKYEIKQIDATQTLANKRVNSQERANQLIKKSMDKSIDEHKKAEDAKVKFSELSENTKLQLIGDTLQNASTLIGKETVAGKALAIAGATIDTYRSANLALATLPPPFGAIAAGINIATGLKTVSDIVSVQVPGQSGGGSTPSIATTAPITPQFQEAQTVNLSANTMNQMNNVAMRAYVVESDISNSQQRIKRLENSATF